jgi:hypothetical protein
VISALYLLPPLFSDIAMKFGTRLARLMLPRRFGTTKLLVAQAGITFGGARENAQGH